MKVHFNDLPQTIRERLLAVFANPQDPRVLLYNYDARLGWFKYVTAIGGAVAIGLILNFLLDEGARKDPWYDREVYAGLAFAVAVFVTSVVGIVYRFLWKPPPYREGNYVFKSAIVNADGGELEILPLHELGRPTIVHTRRNGAYTGSRLELQHHQGKSRTFTFYYGSQDVVGNACDKVLGARERWIDTLRSGNAERIGADDVFAECTMSGEWKSAPGAPPTPPLAAVVPRAAVWLRWLGSLVFGLAVAGVTFVAIDNLLEDDRKAWDRKWNKKTGHGKGY